MAVSDWKYWLALSEVEAWQAVALSLEIDPDGMKGAPGYLPPSAFPDKQVSEEFRKRLTLLIDALHSDSKRFSKLIPNCVVPAQNSVRLKYVAIWLKSLGRTPIADQLLMPIAESPPTQPEESDILSDLVDSHVENSNAIELTPEVLNDDYGQDGVGVPSKRSRRHHLDPIIDRAIEQAGGLDSAHVWIKLKEMALNSEPPLLGTFETKTGAIGYTDSKNKPAWFTLDALQMRLGRRARRSQ